MQSAGFLSLLFLSGCGIFPCIDSQFERVPKSIEQTFDVVLTIDNRTTGTTITCEEYYDAMCAERGNFWSIREVGTESMYDRSILNVKHPSLGKVETHVPSCASMVPGELPPLEHTILRIEKENYWLIGSSGSSMTYSNGDQPPEIITLDLELSVNGESLLHELNNDS